MTTKAIDISNYTSTLTPESLAAWKADGVGLVIPQAVDPPAGFPPGKTRLQVRQCSDAGFVVDAYIWLWFDLDVDDIRRKLALLEGLPIRRLWLDVEDQAAAKYDQAICEGKVQDALNTCDAWRVDQNSEPTGVYSGHWFWADARYMGNTEAFKYRALWDSNYDDEPDAAVNFRPYGGWQSCAIKQWKGTSTYLGVGGVDLNVLSIDEEAELTGGTPPVTDEEKAQMQDKIDGLTSALGLVGGDYLKPLTRKSAAAYIKTFVGQVRAVCDQFGVNHA